MWAAIKSKLGLGRKPAEESPGSPAPGEPPSKSDSAEGRFTDSWLGTRIREGKVDEVLDELEVVLLQSDVALPVIDKMRKNLAKELTGKRIRLGGDVEGAIRESLEATVRQILSKPGLDLVGTIRSHSPKPYIVLFVGVNGTGKTTTVAKIAGRLRDAGLTVVIAAGDTFRAGAIEQLLVHGERLGIRVIRQQEGSDPAAVAFDALEHARARHVDAVLIDTAGRQHTNENLIQEAKKIRRVVSPHLTLFVGDALSGNDVTEQARLFDEALGVDGLVLTKLDADVRGGGALSATFVTGKPILFVGVGQGYQDLKPFDPEWMVARLFQEGAAA